MNRIRYPIENAANLDCFCPRSVSMQPIIDAHFHIFSPDEAMPGHAGFVPSPFGVEEYCAQAAALGIVGGVNVAGSVQGGDPRPLLEAAAALGPGFVVV